jgi:mono/diheme cytochrome c family protein
MGLCVKFAGMILLGLGILLPAWLAAQSPKSSTPNSAPALTEQQKMGEGLFLNNCSLCHLPHKEGNPKSTQEGNSYGPSLKGLFRGAKPVLNDQVARQFVMKGTQKMPGFQYSLEPKEIDSIIAYLKTL